MEMKTKLKANDNVQVVTGREKGKTGRVLRIDRKNGKVIVQSLNMVKKAMKQRRQNEKGGIIDIEAPLDISNVMILCRKCGPTRIGFEGTGNDKKRVCKKCGEAL